MRQEDFDEYIRQVEPVQQEKARNWQTAIGLQAVDGLRVSDYLKHTAQRHIEGEISTDDVRRLIKEYYQTKTKREPDD
ncbi:MAG: antitoxin VbhA family protein, partial [Bacteroidales bacterium]|nr:antitoxin VbhA family protein [Bacteroidales bacterium]